MFITVKNSDQTGDLSTDYKLYQNEILPLKLKDFLETF